MTLAPFKTYSLSKRLTVCVSGTFILVSLFFTAFTIKDGDSDSQRTILAFEALLGGWYGALTLDAASISWFANPAWVLSIVFFDKNRKLALICSIAALLLSNSFLIFDEVIANEGGGKREILSTHSGYYLWLVGQAITFVALFFQIIKESSGNKGHLQ